MSRDGVIEDVEMLAVFASVSGSVPIPQPSGRGTVEETPLIAAFKLSPRGGDSGTSETNGGADDDSKESSGHQGT